MDKVSAHLSVKDLRNKDGSFTISKSVFEPYHFVDCLCSRCISIEKLLEMENMPGISICDSNIPGILYEKGAFQKPIIIGGCLFHFIRYGYEKYTTDERPLISIDKNKAYNSCSMNGIFHI